MLNNTILIQHIAGLRGGMIVVILETTVVKIIEYECKDIIIYQ